MANTKVTAKVIADGTITATQIANDAVTGAKIADDVALAGNPTTTTQSAGNSTTRIATTAFVTTAVDNLIDSAPGALNTLNELAAALGDDANFNTTVTNSIAAKLPLAGGTMTGALNMGSQNITNGGNATFTNLTLSATEKLRFDGAGGHTFIHESSNDTLVFATGGSTRLTLDADATFSGQVTATKLTASNGLLELDDNGSHNGIINSPASLRINFDSDGNSTGESFQVGSNATNIDSNNIHFIVKEDGLVGINQTSPAAKLDIKGDTDTYDGMSKIYLTDTSSNANRRNWAIGNGGSGYGHFSIGVSNAADGDPMDASGNHTVPFSITHNSNVGVGGGNFDYTSTFHVVGNNASQVASNGAGIDGIQVSRTTGKSENLYMYSLSGTGWSGSSFVGRIESYGHNVLEIGGQQNIPIVFGTNNSEAFRINNNQILLHGGTRQTYGDQQRITSGSESITFSSSTSATSFTSSYNLAYQFFIDVAYHFGYVGNGAISQHFRHSIINTFSGLSISAIHSAYGQSGNNYHTISFSGTGSYNTRRIVVTCTPASGQNASNIAGTLYFGGGV